jgi:hypothetical protein
MNFVTNVHLCHLSGFDVAIKICAAYPLFLQNLSIYQLNESLRRLLPKSVHGISTREVYPIFYLHSRHGCSYHPFSPLPHIAARRLFSVTLAVKSSKTLRFSYLSHLLGGAALYVVRTFLPCKKLQKATERFAVLCI